MGYCGSKYFALFFYSLVVLVLKLLNEILKITILDKKLSSEILEFEI